MRKKPRRFTVDMYDTTEPLPGDVVRHQGHRGNLLGYLRVLDVRRVKVRVSRGEVARYVLALDRLDRCPEDFPRLLTVTDHPPTPKRDRFSPLL